MLLHMNAGKENEIPEGLLDCETLYTILAMYEIVGWGGGGGGGGALVYWVDTYCKTAKGSARSEHQNVGVVSLGQ